VGQKTPGHGFRHRTATLYGVIEAYQRARRLKPDPQQLVDMLLERGDPAV